MALSYKARKTLSLLILVVGLPVYVVVAVTIINLFERPPILVEMAIYVTLGIAWAFPLKWVFQGIGQADPDDPEARR